MNWLQDPLDQLELGFRTFRVSVANLELIKKQIGSTYHEYFTGQATSKYEGVRVSDSPLIQKTFSLTIYSSDPKKDWDKSLAISRLNSHGLVQDSKYLKLMTVLLDHFHQAPPTAFLGFVDDGEDRMHWEKYFYLECNIADLTFKSLRNDWKSGLSDLSLEFEWHVGFVDDRSEPKGTVWVLPRVRKHSGPEPMRGYVREVIWPQKRR
jgi:hypothetical protein